MTIKINGGKNIRGELYECNDVNEYIIISVKDIKNMLSGEEYEKILPIEENSNKSKKLVKDFDNI